MSYMNNVVLSEMSKTKSKSKRGHWAVILHDDNKLSFDHVIECLIDICGHNQFQAHQCALIVHSKKRCAIYIDSYESCITTSEILNKFRLTTTIEKHETDN